jgi:hypothetical protein
MYFGTFQTARTDKKCHCDRWPLNFQANAPHANKKNDSREESFFTKRCIFYGAGGRTRTDMSVTSPDFESGAYTDFATPALEFRMIKMPSHLVNPWRVFCIHKIVGTGLFQNLQKVIGQLNGFV